MYTLFDVSKHHILEIFFKKKVLINLAVTADFPLLCLEYISISLSGNHDSVDLL